MKILFTVKNNKNKNTKISKPNLSKAKMVAGFNKHKDNIRYSLKFLGFIKITEANMKIDIAK